MKKFLAALLSLSLVLSTAACGINAPQVTLPGEATEATQATRPRVKIDTEEWKAKLDDILKRNKFQGIVSLTHNNEVVYQSATGSNDLGDPLHMDSPVFLCSVSKQFCAASVLMLRDQGKLSLEDTLNQYFPEYAIGKNITIKNLLSMRSGIVRDMEPMMMHPEAYKNNTLEENEAIFKEWLFEQPLVFEPDSKWQYSNTNYILLSFIVEAVSGENYEDFVRKHIFQPLGMTQTGFHWDIRENAPWTQGLTYDKLISTAEVPLLAQGAGGITSTAADMDKWMVALQSGQVICEESYREMITDHSPEADNYGYGLSGALRGGITHNGGNGGYGTYMYFNEEYGIRFFIASNAETPYTRGMTVRTAQDLLNALYTAIDAAEKQ